MLLSLIIPTYNSLGTLQRWFASVFSQGRLPDEIIYVDGGSTDGTLPWIHSVLRPTDKMIAGPDAGPYDAMNKGVRAASGDIIAILNSDDEWKKDALAGVARVFKQQPEIDIVHGMVEFRLKNGRSIVLKPSFGLRRWLGLGLPSVHPATFVRKRVYLKVGLFDFKRFPLLADQHLIYRALSDGCLSHYMDEILTTMHQGGLSSAGVCGREINRLLWSFPWYRKIPVLLVRSVLWSGRHYCT